MLLEGRLFSEGISKTDESVTLTVRRGVVVGSCRLMLVSVVMFF